MFLPLFFMKVFLLLIFFYLIGFGEDINSGDFIRLLYNIGDYQGCIKEIFFLENEQDISVELKFLKSMSLFKLGKDEAEEELKKLAYDVSVPLYIKEKVFFVLGRLYLSRNRAYARDYFIWVFLNSENNEYFVRSSYILTHFFFNLVPRFVQLQLKTVYSMEGMDYISDYSGAEEKKWVFSLARFFVLVYRNFVSSAIGRRCALYPSCSEYFLQAVKTYGWFGFPMQADRFVREPDVVALGERIIINGKVKYYDPLSAHDFWFKQ